MEAKTNINTIDKPAFELLFKQHYSNMCAYAFNFVKDQEVAEELVQNIFFKLWVNRKSIEIESSVESYLFRSIRNAALNLIKHINIREEYKKHKQSEDQWQEQNDADFSTETELQKLIRQAINKLPEQRRKIFIQSRYDGLKYREIADKMGISIKTVENQMGKALGFLRTELKDYLPVILLFFSHLFLDE
ncbi:RNA polymerase sigma-70 factor [Prolixibacteraceae bacterium JC049]|nr:RNA polymerase sigma-70 factor [Prolixibacteraceae bacterium JC049]